MAEEPGFHGLFIGVDNYQDPRFTGLRFAKKDAKVLHALFTDSFGSGTLVVDAEATKDKIMTEIRQLASVATGSDTVVITFSGHGTQSRELATRDTSVEHLAETAIPLGDFVALVETIRAKVLIVVLDCCFSGGAWDEVARKTTITHQAKVLRQPHDAYTSRSSSTEVEVLLRRVSGSGRVVLAASAADERAYETADLGHGVLTHYVIQALLGRGGVVDDNGELSMLKLASYVMTNVEQHKTGLRRKTQNVVLEGSLSHIRMPVLVPGARYREIGDTLLPPVTTALSSLHEHGIPEAFTSVWSTSIARLNNVQITAVNRAGVLRGEPVLVSAPTASGKTLIGEFAAIRAKQNGKRTVFLLPSRALVNEQHDRFHAQYGGLGVKTIRATGELRDQLPDLLRGDYDFAVLTYEKFTGLLTGHPDLLDKIGVLVVDEIQSLFDLNRGPGLEALFTRIRRRRESGKLPQIVGLSAVLGDPEDLASWLGAELVSSRERAVPLSEGVIGPDGRYRGRRSDVDKVDDPEGVRFINPVHSGSKNDVLVDLVAELVSQGRKVIVFRAQRKDVKSAADLLAEKLRLPSAEATIAELGSGDVGALHDRLRRCLGRGVAFHMADLSDQERQVVERTFRRGREIGVLVATTTLAQGVNLPADDVVICELKHPGDIDYSVSDYKNMAGRAGRPGQGKLEGKAFIITSGGVDADHKWNRYVTADFDAAKSALLAPTLDLGTLVLTVVSSVTADRGRCNPQDIYDFLSHTLAAHQARLSRSPDPFHSDRVHDTVEELVEKEFLESNDGELSLTRLGDIVVRHGLGIRSVRRVADVLATITPTDFTDRTLLCAAQLTDELRDVRFIRKSNKPRDTLNDVLGWLRGSGVPENLLASLADGKDQEGHGAASARRAIASLNWTRGLPLTNIESGLLTTFPTRNGEGDPGPILQAMRRAADVIGAIIEIAHHVHPEADLGDLPETLPGRQELGVLAGHVPIAEQLDGELDRSVYLSLKEAQLVNVESILLADESTLLGCLNDDHNLVRMVCDAATAAKKAATRPSLSDVLPLLTN